MTTGSNDSNEEITAGNRPLSVSNEEITAGNRPLSVSNEEITAGNRPLSVSNEEWNQQTIVDARNVIQTQQSVEPSRQFNEQRSSKLKIYVVFFYE
jgi:hypothetical protein